MKEGVNRAAATASAIAGLCAAASSFAARYQNLALKYAKSDRLRHGLPHNATRKKKRNIITRSLFDHRC